jgi:hypothetical protein
LAYSDERSDDVLPENWSKRRERSSGTFDSLKEEMPDEEETVHRVPDRAV